MRGLIRDVTAEEVARYRDEGVVRLAGLLDREWIEILARGIDSAVYEQFDTIPVAYDVTAAADSARASGGQPLSDARADALAEPGRYLSVVGAWMVNDDLRRLALESPLGYVAARLFGATRVNYYDDQVLVKEPRTREYTAFHTDEPYYHLSGDQVCGVWISPDEIGPDQSPMEYVRGSHRWGSFFKPNAFFSQQPLDELGMAASVEEQIPLPDIEGDRDAYDIVTYTSSPGDVIVHHSRLVHGSGPNFSDRTRRAVSLRYAGDDVRYRFHPSSPPQPHMKPDLVDGDRLRGAQFPEVWRRDPTGVSA